MTNLPWWVYVIFAGLSWGMYVPIIFFGGQLLTPDGNTGIGGRLASILCVGVAYFLLAVLVPLALMATQENATPNWRTVGLVFSGLAGVAGAVGAICVIFASSAASKTAGEEFKTEIAALKAQVEAEPDSVKKAEIEETIKEKSLPASRKKYIAKYRMFIAPLIFALAPLINTLLSLVWHPDAASGVWGLEAFHLEMPNWKLPLGIMFVAVGTFLVLFSKEEGELNKGAKHAPPAMKAG